MINKILLSIMLFNLAGVLWVFYLLFAPVPLADIYNIPFPVFPEEVKRGETLEYVIHFNKHKNIEVRSNRNIICADGNLVTLAPVETNAPLGEHKAKGSIVIPEKVSDGECFIEFNTEYLINPIRTEKRTMRTQPFTVIR